MSHRTPHSQKCLLCNVYRKPGESVDEMMQIFKPSTKCEISLKNCLIFVGTIILTC